MPLWRSLGWYVEILTLTDSFQKRRIALPLQNITDLSKIIDDIELVDLPLNGMKNSNVSCSLFCRG